MEQIFLWRALLLSGILITGVPVEAQTPRKPVTPEPPAATLAPSPTSESRTSRLYQLLEPRVGFIPALGIPAAGGNSDLDSGYQVWLNPEVKLLYPQLGNWEFRAGLLTGYGSNSGSNSKFTATVSGLSLITGLRGLLPLSGILQNYHLSIRTMAGAVFLDLRKEYTAQYLTGFPGADARYNVSSAGLASYISAGLSRSYGRLAFGFETGVLSHYEALSAHYIIVALFAETRV